MRRWPTGRGKAVTEILYRKLTHDERIMALHQPAPKFVEDWQAMRDAVLGAVVRDKANNPIGLRHAAEHLDIIIGMSGVASLLRAIIDTLEAEGAQNADTHTVG